MSRGQKQAIDNENQTAAIHHLQHKTHTSAQNHVELKMRKSHTHTHTISLNFTLNHPLLPSYQVRKFRNLGKRKRKLKMQTSARRALAKVAQ
jgi:hypothetical protein